MSDTGFQRLGWSRKLLEKLRAEAGSDQERLLALLRDHVPHESIDVAVRDGGESLREIETNRRTARGEVTSMALMLPLRVEYEIRGKPGQKEEGVEEVLERLTRHMSGGATEGWEWRVRDASARDEEGVDGEICPPSGEPYRVQVTRPVPSSEYMASVAQGAGAKVSEDPDTVAAHVIAAVQAKALLFGRGEILLALDAVSLAHVVLPEVVERARNVDGMGFRAVFVVGPCDDLVFRLDGGSKLANE